MVQLKLNDAKALLLAYQNDLLKKSLDKDTLYSMTAKLKGNLSNILEQERQHNPNYLAATCQKHLNNDLNTVTIYIQFKAENMNEANKQQTKEAIQACLDDKRVLIDAEIDLLTDSQEIPIQFAQDIDEKLFKDELENNLRLNPLYKLYIDKETGEIIISDKLGKTDKELKRLDELKTEQTQDVSSPDYSYLDNYMYTSSYQELALKLNEATSKNVDLPISKESLERYEEYKTEAQKTNEIEAYIGKE